ncbi:hypothetical protein K438DRAFT_1750379 [Mycena galopus ATCC 62051]|nr:hypothetical protein K438DRAFT_1750379 [Mycena galopus ATCC 62051]
MASSEKKTMSEWFDDGGRTNRRDGTKLQQEGQQPTEVELKSECILFEETFDGPGRSCRNSELPACVVVLRQFLDNRAAVAQKLNPPADSAESDSESESSKSIESVADVSVLPQPFEAQLMKLQALYEPLQGSWSSFKSLKSRTYTHILAPNFRPPTAVAPAFCLRDDPSPDNIIAILNDTFPNYAVWPLTLATIGSFLSRNWRKTRSTAGALAARLVRLTVGSRCTALVHPSIPSYII